MMLARFVSAESPFPFADSAHGGTFEVTNPAQQAGEVRRYVVQFVALFDEQRVLLQQDDSNEHEGYKLVSGGMFVFYTEKQGICIDEINLSTLPVSVAPNDPVLVHFYLKDVDLAVVLASSGIPNAAMARARNCRFQLELRLEAATQPPVAIMEIVVV